MNHFNLNRKSAIIFTLVSAVLFSSCGTIFGGRYATIKVNSNIDSSTVFVDDKNVGITPLTLRVKKKDELKIRVEKNGFRTSNDVYVEKKIRAGFVYADLLGAAGTGVSVGLFAIKNDALGAVVMGAGSVFLMIPVFKIDFKTGKWLKVTKGEYNLNLVPKPDTADAVKSRMLICEDFNFKINPGEVIGKIKVNSEDPKDIKWTNTNNLKSEDFIVYVNNQLEGYGYNVAGLGKFKNQKKSPAVRLEVEVRSVDLQLLTSYYPGVISQSGVTISDPINNLLKSDVKLDMKWRIADIKTGEILYEKLIPGYSTKYNNELQIALYDAIEYSLSLFLADTSVKERLKDQPEPTTSELISNDTASVYIKTNNTKPKGSVKDRLQLASQSVVTIETDFGSGSGFMISEDGYLVTNAHVVEKLKQVNVIFSNGYSFTADVIRVSEQNDLALLKVKGKGFKPLTLVNDANIGIGSEVYAIGAPLGNDYSQSITKGIVSGYRIKGGKRYIQTDVSISPGNSGGPIISNNFEVLGVVQSKMVGEGVEGIGFCIPAEEVISLFNIRYR